MLESLKRRLSNPGLLTVALLALLPSVAHARMPTPVPEPTLLSLALGALAAGVVAHRLRDRRK